jgi:hypothetical protein
MDSNIWGPHYWFFIHSLAYSYPEHPNATTKRKYYDIIQNIPLFLPDGEMGNKFSHMLDVYPVSPYLNNRDSFIRWTHFIHNKVNAVLGKEQLTFFEAKEKYEGFYKPKPVFLYETFKVRKQMFHLVLIVALLFILFMVCK